MGRRAYPSAITREKLMKKETPQSTPHPESKRKKSESPVLPNKTKGLDFAKLDLTVERVDERLSPSETNIFDK